MTTERDGTFSWSVRATVMVAALPIAILVSALAGVPAEAQRVIGDPPADYRHSGTGTAFPPSIGRFVRGTVREYSADGRDASASYDLARNDRKVLTITVFVYPAPPGTAACRDQFAETVASLRQAQPAATRIETGTTPSPFPALAPAGAHAAFSSHTRFDGKDQPVRTDAWLLCASSGRWLVKYRATGLADAAFDTDVAAFMRQFTWSDGVGG